MQVLIRNVEKRDIARCAEISAKTEMFQQYGLTLERAEELLTNHFEDSNRQTLVAEVEDEVKGLVEIVINGTFGIAPYIQQLVVSPESQGLRLGDKLMQSAEALHQANKYGMSLLVNSMNDGAIRFYQRLGYRQVGQIEGFIKPHFTELIFHKKFAIC